MSLIGIKAHSLQNQGCSSSCHCTCHDVYNFRSPHLLSGLLGTLFMGYSGRPIPGLKRCTEDCLAQTPFRTYVHYIFPTRFVQKALTITLLSLFRAEIGLSLTMSGIIVPGAEISRAILSDDVHRLKHFMKNGLVLPNDRSANGSSILYVSRKHLILLLDHYTLLMLCRYPVSEIVETCCDTLFGLITAIPRSLSGKVISRPANSFLWRERILILAITMIKGE